MTPRPATPVWFRSLYWRIATGFIGLLAALLIVQAFVFLWMTGRIDVLFPSRSPAQFAARMAADVSAALAASPDLDLDDYVRGHYGRALVGYVVVRADGRTIVSSRIPPPPQLSRVVRNRLAEAGAPIRDGGDQGRFGGRRGGGAGRGGGPPTPSEIALITVGDQIAGAVGVPGGPPPWQLTLSAIGPTLALVASVLLLVGAAVASLVIVRPIHTRLRGLQRAAAALGAGDRQSRAPEQGGDEVAALARSFNDMASRLEERTQALEAADRTRRQLLADVSHELSTPLAAIRGYVETLDMAGASIDAAAKQRYLHIVLEEAQRLEHIIGDLLDLARLEGGGVSFDNAEVPLAPLIDRLRDRHAPALSRRRIAFEVTMPPAPVEVRGDATRLEQALQNVVANAIRHTPEGGTLAVTVDADAEDVRIRVDDTGPGIPIEHLPHIFDRFYKADAARAGTPIPSGSGLGLSIVQAIVARHGGAVVAENRPDGGARFEIRLPRFRAAGAQT